MGLLNTIRFITNHPLNSQNKLAALRRFICWQIGSRLVPGSVVISFVNDSKLLVSPGMTGATGNIYTGLHEFEDMAFVLHCLRREDVFVDVGANVGSYTVLAGAVIGAKCYAFEPVPQTYSHLIRNINLNGINKLVGANNLGISCSDGMLEFTAGLDTVNHVVTENDGAVETIKVAVKTLDNAMGKDKPTIIKIDVEGFETNVIVGANKVLSQASLLAIIMELNGSGSQYGFDELALHTRMLDYGFTPYRYAPFARSLVALAGKNLQAGNTLYVRDVRVVQARLQAAPAFFVNNRKV